MDKVDPSIETKIQESRRILEFEDDWDGEGSPGYSQGTWDKATTFLREFASSLQQEYGVTVDAPDVLPGPNGSIDIHWETEKYELLINVPVEGDAATFYGDDYEDNFVKGRLNIMKANPGLCVFVDSALS